MNLDSWFKICSIMNFINLRFVPIRVIKKIGTTIVNEKSENGCK